VVAGSFIADELGGTVEPQAGQRRRLGITKGIVVVP